MAAQQIIYAKQSDWETWKGQFIRRAKGSQLWTYIDPESTTSWPTEPTEPILANIQRRPAPRTQRSTVTARASPRRTTRSTTAAIDADTHVEEVDNNEDEGTEGYFYHDTLSLYKERKADYRRHINKKEELADWMYSTVAPEILEQLCDPDESIREWYAALYDANKPYESMRSVALLEEYNHHLQNLKKSARTLSTWIQGWKTLMARGIKLKVGQCTDATVWSTDFIKATKSLAITAPWAQNLALNQHEDVLSGKITYLELAAQLERFVAGETSAGSSRQIKVGAFPTFHGQDPDEKEPGAKTFNQERHVSFAPTGPRGRGGNRGSSNRARGNRGNKYSRIDSGSARVKCKACLQGHTLEDCFYVFPELAPRH